MKSFLLSTILVVGFALVSSAAMACPPCDEPENWGGGSCGQPEYCSFCCYRPLHWIPADCEMSLCFDRVDGDALLTPESNQTLASSVPQRTFLDADLPSPKVAEEDAETGTKSLEEEQAAD